MRKRCRRAICFSDRHAPHGRPHGEIRGARRRGTRRGSGAQSGPPRGAQRPRGCERASGVARQSDADRPAWRVGSHFGRYPRSPKSRGRRLGANWKTRRAFWADRAANEAKLRTNLLSLDTTRTRHVGNDPHPERYDPDLWTDEYAFLNKPGQADIQSDLFYDYRTNVDSYPKWQAWMQKTQPRLLVIWGKYELSFDPSEPEAYRRDMPKAEVHIVDGGHFALDTAANEIADLARRFLSNKQ